MIRSSASSDTNSSRNIRWNDLSLILPIGGMVYQDGTSCRYRIDLPSEKGASEESPDWEGHPAVESTDGSNLMNAVTENKPPARVRMKPRGKSSRRSMATYSGDGTRTSKAKYTGRAEVPTEAERAARSLSGGRLRR